MSSKKTSIIRVDNKFLAKFDNAFFERYKNKLVSRREYSRPEGFRLLSRIPEFDIALEKLKKFPKKEDLL